MKKRIIGVFLLFSSLGVNAQQITTGYIFEDRNNNGKKERMEKGIADVAVSNGQDVVVTDSDAVKGRCYYLCHKAGRLPGPCG
ncbi:MAG: hypothetical protein LBS04_02150 [Tannerellaceae bacterium]|jgi:hypothetical protein|nr:hypothetical protein [Tannerellaceae bacterium]